MSDIREEAAHLTKIIESNTGGFQTMAALDGLFSDIEKFINAAKAMSDLAHRERELEQQIMETQRRIKSLEKDEPNEHIRVKLEHDLKKELDEMKKVLDDAHKAEGRYRQLLPALNQTKRKLHDLNVAISKIRT